MANLTEILNKALKEIVIVNKDFSINILKKGIMLFSSDYSLSDAKINIEIGDEFAIRKWIESEWRSELNDASSISDEEFYEYHIDDMYDNCYVFIPSTTFSRMWLKYSQKYDAQKRLKKDKSKFKLYTRRKVVQYIKWCLTRLSEEFSREPLSRRLYLDCYAEIDIKKGIVTKLLDNGTNELFNLYSRGSFQLSEDYYDNCFIKKRGKKIIITQNDEEVDFDTYELYYQLFYACEQNGFLGC
jgi:hypothetical protein